MDLALIVWGEGGFGGMPPEFFFFNTLNNAFWRHIYTELKNQAISQVIIEIMFTGIKKTKRV